MTLSRLFSLKQKSRRGQTALEYLLLMGAVSVTVVALKNVVLDGMFAKVLPDTVGSAKGEAATGGRKLGYYYVNSTTRPEAP